MSGLFEQKPDTPSVDARVHARLALVVEALSKFRFLPESEATLQASIARILAEAGIWFEREAWLDARDRIDFLANGDIGVELKVDGSAAEVLRQLERYALSPRIGALILVTTLNRHRVPDAMNGKAVTVIRVGSPFG